MPVGAAFDAAQRFAGRCCSGIETPFGFWTTKIGK
jgi:hypothetical protein